MTAMSEDEASLLKREPFLKPRWISTESYGFLLLLLSAVTYSGMGCFIKLASATGLPSTQLVFFRATFQGFFVVIGLIVFRAETEAEGGNMSSAEGQKEPTVRHGSRRTNRLICTPFGGTWTVRKIVLTRGCVGGLGFVLYFYTISVLPLGDAVTLLSMYPIITIFFARIFLGEIARTTHILAAVASVTGAILIARPRFLFGSVDNGPLPDAGGGIPWLGYMTAALGSCTGSAVFILIRKAGTVGAHTLQLLFSWVCFGTIFSLAFGILQSKHDDGEWRLPPSRTSWMYVMCLCCIGSAAHFLMNYAGRLAPAGLASVTRSSGLMWAYMFEVLIFREVPKASTIVGVVLIAMSLVAITLQKVRDERLASAVTQEKVPIVEQDSDEEAEIELGVNKGGNVTSKVDLHSRYWKVPVVDDDEAEWSQ